MILAVVSVTLFGLHTCTRTIDNEFE